MTATLYPPRRADRATPRPIGRPDYTVRRLVAAAMAAMFVVLVAVAAWSLVGAVVDVGGRPVAASAGTSDSSAAPVVRVHVAQPGDTLWSIADQHRGEVGHARFVDALIDLNGGTVIQAGQAVRLP